MESFEVDGVWWKPNVADEAVAGRLTFESHGRSSLSLIGTLLPGSWLVNLPASTDTIAEEDLELLAAASDGGYSEPISDDGQINAFPMEVDILHGVVSGAMVTLHRLLETARDEHSYPSFCRQEFVVGGVLRGAHLATVEAAFDSVNFSLDRLTEWCGYELNAGADPGAVAGSWHGSVDTPGRRLEAGLPKGRTLLLGYRRDEHTSDHEHRVSREAECHVDLPEPASLNDILSTVVRPIQDLLTAGTGRPSAVTRLWATSSIATDRPDRRVPIEIGVAGLVPSPSSGSLLATQMLLPLQSIDFESFLPSWFETRDTNPVAGDFVFGNRYGEGGISEQRFLSACTAAEALHSSLGLSIRTPVEVNETALAMFLESFPEAERSLLRTRALQLNHPSLADRLQTLVDRLGNAAGTLAPRGWVRLVVRARNDVTHGRPSRPNGRLLLTLTEALTHVVEVTLLAEAGVNLGAIASRLESSPRYRWLRDLTSEYVTPELEVDE